LELFTVVITCNLNLVIVVYGNLIKVFIVVLGSKFVSFCKDQNQSSVDKCKIDADDVPVPSTSAFAANAFKPSVASLKPQTRRELRKSPRVVLKRCNEYSRQEEDNNSKIKRGRTTNSVKYVDEESSEDEHSSADPVAVFDALDSDFNDFADDDAYVSSVIFKACLVNSNL